MPSNSDLRASKMESSEGRGIAYGRWVNWWRALPQDLKEALDLEHPPMIFGLEPNEMPEPEVWKEMATEARERSELIGFWVAWHSAGGFHGLELSGWNRATIYRKLKHFRSVFDAHPDEHDFDWIQLDLPKIWFSDIGVEIAQPPHPELKAKK